MKILTFAFTLLVYSAVRNFVKITWKVSLFLLTFLKLGQLSKKCEKAFEKHDAQSVCPYPMLTLNKELLEKRSKRCEKKRAKDQECCMIKAVMDATNVFESDTFRMGKLITNIKSSIGENKSDLAMWTPIIEGASKTCESLGLLNLENNEKIFWPFQSFNRLKFQFSWG